MISGRADLKSESASPSKSWSGMLAEKPHTLFGIQLKCIDGADSLAFGDIPHNRVSAMYTSLSIRSLTKEFDGFQALKGLDLDVPAGRFVTLLGPSGCGKTTLLRSIAGISDPSSGEIWLADRRIDGVAPEK